MRFSNRSAVAGLFVGAAAVAGAQTIQMTGAGATFPAPIYQKWFDTYKTMHPNVEINYQPVGSGAGIKQVTEGTVDFGASDVGMNDDQLKEFETKRGNAALLFPTVLGSVVPAYNVPGVTTQLRFTPAALAGIYLGTITKWNDPAIAKENPGVKLTGSDIVVIHRSDGSGTTGVWADYLSKVSPEWLKNVGRGTSVNWPVGLGGKGNDGVAGLVQQTAGSIGYIELFYALQNKIPYGSVRNSSGHFISATLANTSVAAAGVKMPEDFRVSITDSPAPTAYPIATFTWLLVPSKFQDPAKAKVMVEFLRWMLKDGQKMTEALSYAPLPKEVVAEEEKAIVKVK